MDTSNDYLFALQLQNDMVDLTGEFFDYTVKTETVKEGSESGAVVDLSAVGCEQKPKRDTVHDLARPIKRQRLGRAEPVESVVDHSWEMLDPNPDIRGLFLAFNRQYFWSALDSVTVQWSKRMTVCAGLCRYQGAGLCSISLSEPLLKLRPRKDLVETLLHEMIHAYLFLTNNSKHRDRDGHGPEFCKHMYRINISAGTEISIYHNFHDEVRLYRQHWWKCNGPCQDNKPFYGYVKRSVNRAPGPSDQWWANHQAVCGGTFIKIKEPEGYGSKKKSAVPSVPKKSVKPANKITNFIKTLDSPTKNRPDNSKIDSTSTEKVKQEVVSREKPLDIDLEIVDDTILCPVCNESVFKDWLNEHLENCSQLKEMFGDKTDDECKCPACNVTVIRSLMNEHLDNCKMLSDVFENNDTVTISDDANYVNCPNCNKLIKDTYINEHLDVCLSDETPQEVPIPNSVDNDIECPCCKTMFRNVLEFDDHVDSCLLE